MQLQPSRNSNTVGGNASPRVRLCVSSLTKVAARRLYHAADVLSCDNSTQALSLG